MLLTAFGSPSSISSIFSVYESPAAVRTPVPTLSGVGGTSPCLRAAATEMEGLWGTPFSCLGSGTTIPGPSPRWLCEVRCVARRRRPANWSSAVASAGFSDPWTERRPATSRSTANAIPNTKLSQAVPPALGAQPGTSEASSAVTWGSKGTSCGGSLARQVGSPW